jgi:hypothetical protein
LSGTRDSGVRSYSVWPSSAVPAEQATASLLAGRQSWLTIAAGCALFAATFVYFLSAATDLPDDHFMHVAWGRQTLKGRLLVRDMVVLGMPLQSALSAAAEWLIGYRLLSTAVVFSTAFAAGAVLIFSLARRASGSIWIGLVAAVLQVIASPRSYSYPKVVVYAAVLALLWRYIDRPSRGRAVLVGLGVAVAFYLRHDHGLYLGLVAVGSLILQHAREWRLGARRLLLLAAISVGAIAPYLAYVQVHWGVGPFLNDLRAFATREYQQNRLERWPRWPLVAMDDVVRWSPRESVGATIGVRWAPGSTSESRRAAARRYSLRPPVGGPIESGRFHLSDLTFQNTRALVHDPVIEDTAGIDRETGSVPITGFRVGSLHLLAGLDTVPESGAFLFYVIAGCLAISLLVLSQGGAMAPGLGERGRTKIATVVLVAVVAGVGFIREPLGARVADALVAPLILMAWWAGRFVVAHTRPRAIWFRLGQVAIILLLAATARGAEVVGGLSPFARKVIDWPVTSRQLLTSPPFDAWSAVGSARYEAVRYVRGCTSGDEPLLILWFAPDLYYYADRPFAGRLGFYLEGYWTSALHEELNLSAIERDRPTIALVEAGREETDLYTYPRLLEYVRRNYNSIGAVTSSDGRTIRVLARSDRVPTSIDPEHGWPCYY